LYSTAAVSERKKKGRSDSPNTKVLSNLPLNIEEGKR